MINQGVPEMTTPIYDYAAGRNDGNEFAKNVQQVGPVVGSHDTIPGGQQYQQGFRDGYELGQSGFNADGSRSVQ